MACQPHTIYMYKLLGPTLILTIALELTTGYVVQLLFIMPRRIGGGIKR